MTTDVSTLKRCRVCGMSKELAEFNRRTQSRDGHADLCKLCSRQESAAWHAANPDRARELNKRAAPQKLVQMKARHARFRTQIFEHYGTSCACCGATEGLTVDHIDGDGYEHREALFGDGRTSSRRFYRWLVQSNFPPGFQILCRSCNSSKYRDGACKMHSAAQPARLTTRELRGRIAACVDAASRGEPTVITNYGKPRAVLISYDQWIAMNRIATGQAPIYALTHGLPVAAERPEIARGAPVSVSKLMVRTSPRRLGR